MNSSKRNLAKALGLAGASNAGSIWMKPVVNSVILPGHAQTTTLDCETSFSIPSSTVACSDPDSTHFRRRYWIDDSDPLVCPSLEVCEGDDSECPSPPDETTSFILQVSFSPDNLSAFFRDDGGALMDTSRVDCITNAIESPGGEIDYSIISTAGNTYRVTCALSLPESAPDTGTVMISEVMVTVDPT